MECKYDSVQFSYSNLKSYPFLSYFIYQLSNLK